MSETPPTDESPTVPRGNDAGEMPVEPAAEPQLEAQEDFVHESVDLPDWISVAFGFLLIAIAAAAIWAGTL